MRKLFKWIGILLSSLLGLVVVAAVVLYFVGGAKLNKKYDVPVQTVSIPTDANAVQRGEHLATILICKSCHGDDLSGKVEFEIPGMLSIPTPNLTSGAGGIGSFYTDDDWVRAIQHGVGHDGRALFIMMSKPYHHLGNEDMGALIAYLKSIPHVDNELPERRIEPLGNLMIGAGLFPAFAADQIDHTRQVPAPLQPSTTVAYGEYLSRTCTECHGANFNGAPFGPPGQEVFTPNLTPGGELGFWSEDDFFSIATIGWPAIVTGVAVILAVVFLILMFTVSISFGTVNDVLNSIIGLSNAVLAWILYAERHVYFQNSPDFYRR